jgi:hypothetical protein
MHRLWVPLLIYIPIMHLMEKGWLIFPLNTTDDARKILSLQRWLDSSILMLKEWTPLFDPLIEIFEVKLIWVKLRRLPLEWWLNECLKALGNKLRGFIAIAEETKTLEKRTVAKIIINLRI